MVAAQLVTSGRWLAIFAFLSVEVVAVLVVLVLVLEVVGVVVVVVVVVVPTVVVVDYDVGEVVGFGLSSPVVGLASPVEFSPLVPQDV